MRFRGPWLSILAAFMFAVGPASAQTWTPDPWLADLSQVSEAFRTKYANQDWLRQDRELNIDGLLDGTALRLRKAGSDVEARAIFDRLIARIHDGHVNIHWPDRGNSGQPDQQRQRADICEEMGFSEGKSTPGVGSHLAGYHPIDSNGPFPAGILPVGEKIAGIIRIGIFQPEGSPAICHAAIQALRIPVEKPCDDKCRDSVLGWSYDRITVALEKQVRALESAGASVLIADVTDNGGGSEWVEAAARIVSSRPLLSERRGFVRGAHWSEQWARLADQLRRAMITANPADRSRLSLWVAEAESARRDAEEPCAMSGACSIVARAGYATGLAGSARAGAFSGKDWANLVFSIAQFPYHDGVWKGPLIVLVDSETWSAAEEFAAVLQDNHAAVIAGGRTGGAGCGHTQGGTPTLLGNSGAILELPDCVRFRADGSNEVRGVIPDILIGIRGNDGPALKAKLIQARLPAAIQLAEQMGGMERR